MSKLVSAFGVCGLGLLVSGCAATTTISGDCMAGVNAGPLQTRSYSTDCADNKAATTFVNSERPELQQLGTTMLAMQSPQVNAAVRAVASGDGAPVPVREETQCVVTGITQNPRTQVKTAQMSCTPQ